MPFAVVFGLEALCLLVFLVLGSRSLQRGVISPSPSGGFYLCMILLTLAMGLQTATVRRASGQGVRTTFVTGVLSDWTAAFNVTPFGEQWHPTQCFGWADIVEEKASEQSGIAMAGYCIVC